MQQQEPLHLSLPSNIFASSSCYETYRWNFVYFR